MKEKDDTREYNNDVNRSFDRKGMEEINDC